MNKKIALTSGVCANGSRKFLIHYCWIYFIANTAVSAELEEIVVTAQKRVQSLQDVPISAIVTGGAEIRNNAITKIEDLSASVPNVTVTESALGDLLFIRGVGSGQNAGFEQSVGTFIDGVYYGRGLQTRNAFLDVQRVEILRGPQTTFFGNNTVAGALSIITNMPDTQEWEGYTQLAYEDGTEKASIEGAIGGPVSETFAVRVAGLLSDQAGWQTNTTINEKEPQEEKTAARLSAVWTPSDRFTAAFRAQTESSETKGRALQATGCPPPDGQTPAGYCLAYGIIQPGAGVGLPPDFEFDDRRNGGNGVSPFPTGGDFNDLENMAINLTLNASFGEHELTWVSALNDYDNHRSQAGILLAGPFPADPLPFANIEHVQEDFEQVSHELRWASPSGDSVEYMVGLYHQSSDLRVINDFSAATFATRLSDHRQDETTLSGFSSLTWNVSDAFRVAVGFRYTEVEKDVRRDQILASNQGNLRLADAIPMDPSNPLYGAFVFGFGWQTGGLTASRKDNELMPSVNAQFEFNDDISGYLSYAEGFKAGGFDEQNGRLDQSSFSFEPESVRSLEAGVKATLLDGAMRLNAAIFTSEFEDLQQQTFDGVINFRVTNAASAISSGLEVDLLWQISDVFKLGFQGAYLNAENDVRRNGQCTTTQAAGLEPGCDFSDPANPQQDLSGETLIFSPEFSGSVSLNHEVSLKNGFGLTARLAASFEDNFFQTDDNDPFLVQKAYAKVDLSVRLLSESGKWELAVIGRNLFDKRTSHAGDDLPLSSGSYLQFLDKPRTLAMQARLSF